VEKFIRLLDSPDGNVAEQSVRAVSMFIALMILLFQVWGLGNISGDSPECRDFVLRAGAMGPLLALLSSKLLLGRRLLIKT
jgi:hypothetical protein